MFYILLIITIACINCFDNKRYSSSNKLFRLFGGINNENGDFSRDKDYNDNLFLAYHKWIKHSFQKENKTKNNDEILQEELKEIYKNNLYILKYMEKHNKKRNYN
jgi:hypothetical protein